MASGTVYQAVRDHLAAHWSACPIVHENDAQQVGGDLAAWIQIEMTGTSYAQQSLGAGSAQANRWDEDGILWGYVFVQFGSGSIDARNLAKAFADLFRGALLLNASIEFGDASIGMGQRSEENGNWWAVPVSIEWRRIDA